MFGVTSDSLLLKVDQLTQRVEMEKKKRSRESGWLKMRLRGPAVACVRVQCTKIPEEHQFCLGRNNSEMFTSEPFPSIITHQAGLALIHRALGCGRRGRGEVCRRGRGCEEEGRDSVPVLNTLQRARARCERAPCCLRLGLKVTQLTGFKTKILSHVLQLLLSLV